MKTLQELLTHTRENNGCLEWTRCFNTDGYPRCVWKGSSNGKVHRIVYQLSNPEHDISGQVVRHTCDNPKCINPAHLLLGSHADNMRDRDTRLRHGKALFNPKQVLAMRTLWQTGSYTQKELGAMFGCNHRTAGYVVRNLSYRWVQ